MKVAQQTQVWAGARPKGTELPDFIPRAMGEVSVGTRQLMLMGPHACALALGRPSPGGREDSYSICRTRADGQLFLLTDFISSQEGTSRAGGPLAGQPQRPV